MNSRLPTDEVRYGVVGAGMMGVEHIENLRALDGAVITAVCDPHEPSVANALAAVGDAPAPQVFTDHRALLDAEICDVVVIATPNNLHVDPVLDTMASGHHLLVEKPLCTTIDDCRRVVDAGRDHEGIAWVGLEYRYMPPVQRLINEVAGGAVGDLRMLAIREHRFPFLVKVDNWNRFTANTGGTLVEKCCHYFDLMNLIVGRTPTRVLASGGQDVNHLDEIYDGAPADMLDNAYVIVEYDPVPDGVDGPRPGVRAMLDLCMFAEASRNQEELVAVGDAGKVEAFVPDSTVRIGRRGTHWHDVDEFDVVDDSIGHAGFHHGSSYLEHRDLMEAVRTGGEPKVTLEDGMRAVAVGVAAHRSIDERRPVELSEIL